tara:strand:- start:96 stop:701 length:606 start_codon:yes stop_codon:yes gene_type:complete
MDDHFILEIDDFIPEHVCNEMIKRFESEPNKEQGKVGSSTDERHRFIDLSKRNSKEIRISANPKWIDIDEIIQQCVIKALRAYTKEIKRKIELIGEDAEFQMQSLVGNNLDDCGYVVQRVENDSWYRWHHDDTYNGRIINIIFYLNTLDESDGGRTEFINGRKISPKVGKVLIFPTTWTNIHCGSWVKKYKYMCTTSLFRK